MIEVYKFEEKNEEECRLKCLDTLDVYNNEIITHEINETDKYIIECVKKSDIEDFIKTFIKNITTKMGLETKIEIEEDENIFKVNMFSNNNQILIGKEGRTLEAIQNILRQIISRKTGFNIKITLDASNYRVKKEHYFEKNIKSIINDVMKTKDEIKLDPMNSYKRRIVHSIASEYYNIETESFGEEPNRYVVIRYLEK